MARSAKALMLQGTGSDVGKSLIVAGLCRAFTARGLRVRPFKPQNMSNNAAVTADGGEIGRAQALQARACRIPASVDMNPVLLKPLDADGAQIVVRGRVDGKARARDYQALKPKLLGAVLESFERLAAGADLVLVEGAGSASEINLRANDIANMGFARAADIPVVLVGDIDRGGVIAQIVGTKAVLDPADANLVAGFLVNKFRGDPSLFEDGMRIIERHTGWRSLGLVSFCPEASRLPAEDSLGLARMFSREGPIRVAVPVLPGIANFDDLDPLALESEISLVMVEPGKPLPAEAALVILPGSKTTIAGLEAMAAEGWDIDIFAHVRRGGHVLGICGGYQMLGKSVADPDGIEGPAGSIDGLGLLDVATVLTEDKILAPARGRCLSHDAPLDGFEMHAGRTFGPDCMRPFSKLSDGRPDGAVSANGKIVGTYLHGLFAEPAQRSAWLQRLGGQGSGLSYEDGVERALDAIATRLETHLDLEELLTLAR
jgi:adenosylcobyric acid synthase